MRGIALSIVAVLLAACGDKPEESAGGPPKVAPEGPGGAYLKVYAMRFVEAMRGAKLEAGAFEVSKRAEQDGRFHLGVDVGDKRLLVKLRPLGKGLTPIEATLGDEAVFPGGKGTWARLAGWHALADRAARAER